VVACRLGRSAGSASSRFSSARARMTFRAAALIVVRVVAASSSRSASEALRPEFAAHGPERSTQPLCGRLGRRDAETGVGGHCPAGRVARPAPGAR
jgi:hypothetical protein